MMRIAFIGKMSTGKTSLTDYLVEKYGVTKLSFAEPVKEIAVKYFGMDINKKDRNILQGVGCKFREIRPLVWVDLLESKIEHNKAYVIDDVRFINEAIRLKELGFLIIRLQTILEKRISRVKDLYPDVTEVQLNDISEFEIDEIVEFDYILFEYPKMLLQEKINSLESIIEEVY